MGRHLGQLPLTLGGARPRIVRAGCHHGLEGVGRRAQVVLRDVRNARSLARGVGGESGRARQGSGGPHRVAAGGSRVHHPQVASGPGLDSCQSLTRTVVSGDRRLEPRQHPAGTGGRPQCEEHVVGTGQAPAAAHGHQPWVTDGREDHPAMVARPMRVLLPAAAATHLTPDGPGE